MISISPYLSFDGKCEEAFDFYQSIFGGEILFKGRFEEMPPQEGVTLSKEDLNRIMHMTLLINEHTRIMGSDTISSSKKITEGDNFSMSINVDSKEEADRIFEALSKEGKITMPIDHTFWDSYFGMCTDPFGIHWMVSFSQNSQ